MSIFKRIALAAGLTSGLLVAALASVPASAGPLHDAFCKGSTPTPQHVCDTIKAAEKKPAAASTQLQANQGQPQTATLKKTNTKRR